MDYGDCKKDQDIKKHSSQVFKHILERKDKRRAFILRPCETIHNKKEKRIKAWLCKVPYVFRIFAQRKKRENAVC